MLTSGPSASPEEPAPRVRPDQSLGSKTDKAHDYPTAKASYADDPIHRSRPVGSPDASFPARTGQIYCPGACTILLRGGASMLTGLPQSEVSMTIDACCISSSTRRISASSSSQRS